MHFQRCSPKRRNERRSTAEPTAKVKQRAAKCGDYVSAFNQQKFPRIQLRTIEQLLNGVTIERPSGNVAVDETFKKTTTAKGKAQPQDELDL